MKTIHITSTSRRQAKRQASVARLATGSSCTYSRPRRKGEGTWAVRVDGPEKWVWEAKKAIKKVS